jgi:hypothetical protein
MSEQQRLHGRIIGVVADDESLRVAIRSLPCCPGGFEDEMFESSEAVLGVALQRLDHACADRRTSGSPG